MIYAHDMCSYSRAGSCDNFTKNPIYQAISSGNRVNCYLSVLFRSYRQHLIACYIHRLSNTKLFNFDLLNSKAAT